MTYTHVSRRVVWRAFVWPAPTQDCFAGPIWPRAGGLNRGDGKQATTPQHTRFCFNSNGGRTHA